MQMDFDDRYGGDGVSIESMDREAVRDRGRGRGRDLRGGE